MKILDLPKVDRPRERLEKYGIDKLSDAEVVALFLCTGIKGVNVVDLSKKILKKVSTLGSKNITINNLLEIKGLGKVKAGQIIACLEFGRRLFQNKKSKLILSPQSVWVEMRDLSLSKKEHFVVFFLDVQNQIIKKDIISIGILDTSLVHPREVFEPAIKYSTAQIILAHNHPSNNLEPSPEDISVTRRLIRAGEIIGIEILDHVIVTKDSYFSLKEANLI